jgi:hypothetical protein
LLEQRGFARLLERLEIDRGELLKCLSAICRNDRLGEDDRLGRIVTDRRLATELRAAVRSIEMPS